MPRSEAELKEIEAARAAVMKLFGWRCAGHRLDHAADCVHEIVPKSKLRKWWAEDNMIPLCNMLHDKVHSEGTRKWEPALRRARSESLILLQLGYR